MMDISQAFPSRYLKAADLQGRTVTVVIERIEQVTMGPPMRTSTRWVLYFRDKSKGLILNKTVAQQIAGIAGETEMDRWPGLRIALVPSETTFGRDVVPCVRVAPPPLAVARHG